MVLPHGNLAPAAADTLYLHTPACSSNGPNDFEARERVHSAATMAGARF